ESPAAAAAKGWQGRWREGRRVGYEEGCGGRGRQGETVEEGHQGTALGDEGGEERRTGWGREAPGKAKDLEGRRRPTAPELGGEEEGEGAGAEDCGTGKQRKQDRLRRLGLAESASAVSAQRQYSIV